TARPSVGRRSVVRMRTAVVLPAPLWPSRPRTEPWGTTRSTSRRAHRSSKRRPRPSARTPASWLDVIAVLIVPTVYGFRTPYDRRTLYEMSSRWDDQRERRERAQAERKQARERAQAERQDARERRAGARRGGLPEPIWMRPEPTGRRAPRSRDDIAHAAIAV